MAEKFDKKELLPVGGLILLAAIMRLVPHWPNFTPIGAMALLGGAYLKNRSQAFIVPLAAMFLSDLVIGFHGGMLAVYIAFAVAVVLGMTLRNKVSVSRTALTALASSVIFFVVTNFAVWMSGSLYPKTAAGLAQCFVMAIPFFHYSVLGDLFYTGILFTVHHLAVTRYPGFSKA